MSVVSDSAAPNHSQRYPLTGIDSVSPISSLGSTRCSIASSDCGETVTAPNGRVLRARRSSDRRCTGVLSWISLNLPAERKSTDPSDRETVVDCEDGNKVGEGNLSPLPVAEALPRQSFIEAMPASQRRGSLSSGTSRTEGVTNAKSGSTEASSPTTTAVRNVVMEPQRHTPPGLTARSDAEAQLKGEPKRVARTSRLDYSSCHSSINRSGFRGFLNLFSVCVTAYLIFDPVMRYLETGRFFDSSLAQAMFADVIFLLSFWAHCFCWSFTSFGLYKLYSLGLLSRKAAQFFHQALIFYLVAASVFHCLYKDWPLLPSGFCLIVTHLFLMKMHSFMDTLLNGEFVCLGGDSTSGNSATAAAVANTARRQWAKISSQHASSGPPSVAAPLSASERFTAVPKSQSQRQAEPPFRDTENALLGPSSSRRRTPKEAGSVLFEDPSTTATESKDSEDHRGKTSHSGRIAEARNKGSKDHRRLPCPSIRYFTYYLFCPVLVYESHYPRGPRFRWCYFARKVVELFTALVALYFISVRFLIPVFYNTISQSIVAAFIKLIFPVLCCYLLIFFLLFECVCNLLAELTEFGDREFYLDWWNSTTWDEFARKWNRPVHEFLLRHVYLKTLRQWKWKKSLATTATFFVSAVFHELIMAVCFRAVLFLMFGMMMVQIPLMTLGHHHKDTEFGNWFFWLGMLFGLPFIGIVYGRAHVALIVLKKAAG